VYLVIEAFLDHYIVRSDQECFLR